MANRTLLGHNCHVGLLQTFQRNSACLRIFEQVVNQYAASVRHYLGQVLPRVGT
jgi:hypothetical protein